MGKVYLAGAIAGLTYEKARYGWRKEAAEKLSQFYIETISPMRGKDHLSSEDVLSKNEYAKNPVTTKKGIVTRDRFDCLRSDMLLVNLLGAKSVSIGTMVELGWADANGIPMVVVMEPGNVHEHLFIRELAGWVVEDLDTAIDIIIGVLSDGV